VATSRQAGPQAFDGERALEWVERQVELGPRYPGSAGHAAMQELLPRAIGEAGWTAEAQAFDYRGTTLTNVQARLPNAQGPLILLGAHYDTRRLADRDPVRPTDPVPGANDGASGVAVLLELARVVPTRGLVCDVRLVFFDGEDNGNLDGWEWAAGSRSYASQLTEHPQAVVVVDMVGDRDLALPIERNSTPDLVDEIWSAAESLDLPAFLRDPGPSVLDDHTPFLERGWRAVDIIDFTYPHWHTTADTVDKVSAQSLAQVGQALLAWLERACAE
jgi:Zn-dependent M28 family amino/carboxypeptidase